MRSGTLPVECKMPRESIAIRPVPKEIIQYYEKKVGKNLKRIRNKRGLSAKEVGEIVAISQQQIQKIEAGYSKISGAKLFLIAQHYKQPMENFFFDEEEFIEEVQSAIDIVLDTPMKELIVLLATYPVTETRQTIIEGVKTLMAEFHTRDSKIFKERFVKN